MYNLVKSKKFEFFIIGCILLNMMVMAMVYYEATNDYDLSLENMNLLFTTIFIVEAVAKIVALGPKSYFSKSWNRFDFFVVSTSVVDICISYFLGT